MAIIYRLRKEETETVALIWIEIKRGRLEYHFLQVEATTL